MIDISVEDLVKSFSVGEELLSGFSFRVDQGERVGLLGKNGAGKTTIFKILTGACDYDSGRVWVAPGKKLGLISQIPVYPEGYTVEDVLLTAFEPLREMERELGVLAEEMARDHSKELMQRYDRLSDAFRAAGGYEDRATALNKVCSGLNIPEAMRRQLFDHLSGGEKTRVNLGRLILEDTDILLLDEPTNHLDIHAVEWLEDYLGQFKGTVLAISHDRYFLDRVVRRIVEIESGKAEYYSGNYSFYVEEKERRYQERMRQYEKEQAKIAQLTEAAEKMHLWAFMGNDKLHKRAFSMEKRIQRLQTTDKPTKERTMDIHFSEQEFRGDEVLVLRGVSKGFGQRQLFSGLDLLVTGGERIALIGDNGTGKSTLLKLILKEELPDGGKLRLGPTVKIGYLPQVVHFDHPERNLVDTLIYERNCTPQTARNQLAAFRFRGEDVLKPVSALSGGEQSRLRLCMLMYDQINFLILDEPTNHLDIASREWIEEAVADFEGTLLFVSHDRYFIQHFADRIWELEGGKVTDFRGNYDAYRAKKERERALVQAEPREKEKPAKKEKPRRTGGTKQLEKALSAVEREIGKLEQRQSELEGEIEANACDYNKLQELCQEKEALEAQLEERYERWEELSAQLEEERE